MLSVIIISNIWGTQSSRYIGGTQQVLVVDGDLRVVVGREILAYRRYGAKGCEKESDLCKIAVLSWLAFVLLGVVATGGEWTRIAICACHSQLNFSSCFCLSPLPSSYSISDCAVLRARPRMRSLRFEDFANHLGSS